MINNDPGTNQSLTPASHSKRKWVVLAIGGGVALLACTALATILIVLLLVPKWQQTAVQAPIQGIASVATVSAPSESNNTLGDPNAPVKIVEYADFQCPYCRLYWQETESQVIESYVKTGKVYYEYRTVGGFLGEESQYASEAAYCAGEQGKFWQYHDALFTHWSGENVGDFTPDKLKQYAASVGLDQVMFEQCLTSHRQADRVQQDLENAKSDGIKATPSFLINGTLIEGAEPFATFQQVI
jgi:protein-disulfide isomerase